MNSEFLDKLWNSSFTSTFFRCFDNITNFLSKTLFTISTQPNSNWKILEHLPDPLEFDEFQWHLLKAFTLILFINLVLIYIAWKVFGRNICERFMKPSTSKAIEELKASVSRLKLPKEHTPRI